MRVARSLLLITVAEVSLVSGVVTAADEFERPPISYRDSIPDNCISRLQQQLDIGSHELQYDSEFGYLPAVLDALKVPKESQMLVFSKTSLQVRRITPRTPRAIYFNDDVYVGYCQSGDVVEISAVDSSLGTVFYTLDQEAAEKPEFQRANDSCLICHSSSRTEGVPGHLVRSLYVDAGGQPVYSAGSQIVDHTTPLKERWGGWYVTGTHGDQSHLGNHVVRTKRVKEPVDNSEGQNVLELKDRFNVNKYLSPHSDIVALMVLEHQALVHNHLTKANFATRQAIDYEATMNRVLGHDEGHALDSTGRRIRNAGDDLVDVLLMVNEAPLTAAVSGTAGYTEQFTAAATRDSKGRSLRDLDLSSRMFAYPCSYLVYSEAFEGLPDRMKAYIWQRFAEILSGQDNSDKFAHLTEQDRLAILDILRETKPEFAAFQTAAAQDISSTKR